MLKIKWFAKNSFQHFDFEFNEDIFLLMKIIVGINSLYFNQNFRVIRVLKNYMNTFKSEFLKNTARINQ